MKSKTIKLLKDNIGNYLLYLVIDKDLLKAIEHSKRKDELGYSQVNYCSLKERI